MKMGDKGIITLSRVHTFFREYADPAGLGTARHGPSSPTMCHFFASVDQCILSQFTGAVSATIFA